MLFYSQSVIIRVNSLRLDPVFPVAMSLYTSKSNQCGVDAVNRVKVYGQTAPLER